MTWLAHSNVSVCCALYAVRSVHILVQDGPRRTVQWFKDSSPGRIGEPAIRRHPLNQRKTGSTLRTYVKRIHESGIIQSVRGEPWLTFDEATGTYFALSCGTLLPGIHLV